MICAYDRDLADQWVLQIGNSGNIKFQFPPRMSGDSRVGQWREVPLRDKEELAIFMASESRVMHVEWTYIAGEQKWDTTKISAQIQALKSYFSTVNREGTPELVSKFKFVRHGHTLMSGRLKSVNVSYSTAYVGKGSNAFPLISDVKIEAKVWTAGSPQRVDVPGLLTDIPPEWA